MLSDISQPGFSNIGYELQKYTNLYLEFCALFWMLPLDYLSKRNPFFLFAVWLTDYYLGGNCFSGANVVSLCNKLSRIIHPD